MDGQECATSFGACVCAQIQSPAAREVIQQELMAHMHGSQSCLERNYTYSILKSSNPFYGDRIPPQSGQFPAEMDRTIPAGEPRAFPLSAEFLAAVLEDGMRHDVGAYRVAFLSSEKKSERGSQP